MNNTSSQRTLFVDELYDIFKKAHLTTDKAHFITIVDCFFQVLDLPVTNDKLEGLSNHLTPIVGSSFDGDVRQRRKDFRIIALTLEPWLKKLLSLLDPEEYTNFGEHGKMAYAYCRYFQLIPPRVKTKKGEEKKEPEFAFELQKQMYETYKWRNEEAHTAKKIPNKVLNKEISNAWIAYLYPVATHFTDLRKIVAQHQLPNLRPYLTRVIQKYVAWRKTFVAIDGYDLEYSPGMAEEQLTLINEMDENANLPKKSIEAWRDELVVIAQKQRQGIPNRMLIWGAAGTGKSTTLMMLSVEDAIQKQADYNNLNHPIPVFLRLNTLDKNENIVAHIANQLALSKEKSNSLLEKGYLRLYLDGLNEITTRNNLRGEREGEIERLLIHYPKTFMLISSREENGVSFQQVRVFKLLSMDRAQIRDFLQKNTKKEDTRQLISQTIQLEATDRTMVSRKAKHLYRFLQTPLFLFYMIQIVDKENKIPSSKNEVIKTFINKLLHREIYQQHQKQISRAAMLTLLNRLGYESLELYASNEGIDRADIATILLPVIRERHLNVNLNQFLELARGLNILRLENSKYIFSHQSFQDYFHSKGRWEV